MNLLYAQVVSVGSEDGAPAGKVSVWGVMKTVPFHLVPEARPGDTVLLCDGVAIGKVSAELEQSALKGDTYVPGNSR
jgi:hydrogenase maturation factor